jgi:hypothetical protein
MIRSVSRSRRAERNAAIKARRTTESMSDSVATYANVNVPSEGGCSPRTASVTAITHCVG